MAKWVFLNDSFVAEEKAMLHFRDLSFQRGYGVFDFFRLAGSKPLFLDDHLDRFNRSAEGLHLPLPTPKKELNDIVLDLVQKNDLPGTGIRLSLSGGYSEDGFNIGQPNFLVSQHSFTPPPASQLDKGIRLLTYSYQRQLPHIKSIDYLMAIWLQPQRAVQGADDILYHHNGFISECPRSNFFLVTADDRVVTPSENILSGVTRKKVLDLAKEYFQVEERPVGLAEIQTAKEAFITSTTKQILPVAQIDDKIFARNPVTRKLMGLFHSTYNQA
ncbi:aminotransferase class IV [Flavisolibacter nicotianae]|uniref:aminotransferase class IV n=1 Tax=Flavisolibacter nicotianae TaxID=2364882 RepID=UPI000EB5A4B7|nr:aminotransferase class IV [Flavisolibacter nicotianae]